MTNTIKSTAAVNWQALATVTARKRQRANLNIFFLWWFSCSLGKSLFVTRIEYWMISKRIPWVYIYSKKKKVLPSYHTTTWHRTREPSKSTPTRATHQQFVFLRYQLCITEAEFRIYGGCWYFHHVDKAEGLVYHHGIYSCFYAEFIIWSLFLRQLDGHVFLLFHLFLIFMILKKKLFARRILRKLISCRFSIKEKNKLLLIL